MSRSSAATSSTFLLPRMFPQCSVRVVYGIEVYVAAFDTLKACRTRSESKFTQKAVKGVTWSNDATKSSKTSNQSREFTATASH
jgi:hypothetical protein